MHRAEDHRVRVRACAADAAGLLGTAVDPDGPPGAVLAELRAAAEDLLTSDAPGPDRPAELGRLLLRIDELERDGTELDRDRRYADLQDVQAAAGTLRGLVPEDVIEAAPRALADILGFGRAMVSSVSGSVWLPRTLYHHDDAGDGAALQFLAYVARARIPLRHTMLETELIRRRIPALVLRPEDDERTFKAIVAVSRSSAYVAAPVSVGGRVIGLLHADRPRGGGAPTEDDRDRVAAFATRFAIAYEQAVLRRSLGQQRRGAREAFARTEEVLRRLEDDEVGLREDHPDAVHDEDAAPRATPAPDRMHGLLTPREREVLALLATGATNTRIAQQLVISEGTVKSHVKHILHKLRAPSRAAAVARYARISRPDRAA